MKPTLCLFTVLILLPWVARTESEPDDNVASGASIVEINGAPASGTMVEFDQDHYRIVNTLGYTHLKFHYAFDGSGNDFHTLRIYDDVGNSLVSTSTSNAPAYEYTGTIDLPKTGIPVERGSVFVFRVECLKDAAGGARTYTLTVTGAGAQNPNAALIPDLQAQIARAKVALRKADTPRAKAKIRLKMRALKRRLRDALNG